MTEQNHLRTSEDPGPGSQTSLRHANVYRVVEAIWLAGSATQADLSRSTSLAPSTVSGIVHDLTESGLVSVEEGHGGRRGRRVSLASTGCYLVAIDIGHAHVRVGLATPARTFIDTRYWSIDADHSHTRVLNLAAHAVDEIRSEHGIPRDSVVSGGLSLPAPVDHETGRLLTASTVLPGWTGVDLVDEASAAMGVPVKVDNDANTAALAEHRWGAGRGLDNLAYIKLGHGVGAGLILNGQVFRGASGVSGEIGHTIVEDYGSFCRCGNRGCLETVVNASTLVERIEPLRPELNSINAIVDSARAGDPACARLIADAARATGRAAANLCNLLSPQALVIGGSLAGAGPLLLDPLSETVHRFAMPSAVAHLKVVASHYGPDTHLHGALGLGLDALTASLSANSSAA